MPADSTREIVRQFIKKNLVKKQEHLEINDRDNIIENGIVDSLGLIKMVNFLEERFSLRLQDDDLVPENFESIESIAILLERTLNRPLERS